MGPQGPIFVCGAGRMDSLQGATARILSIRMDASFTISFEGDHIKVLSDGAKNLDYATRLWTAIVEACNEHKCYRVLGIADTTSPMPPLDGYQHADLFRKLGITRNYRVAWVELNQEAKEATYFVETVLFNRGLPGRLFDSVADATEWLLTEDNT